MGVKKPAKNGKHAVKKVTKIGVSAAVGSKQKTIIQPFHLAFPCHSIAKARAFYGGVLGCKEGRSTDIWCDFNFFGHQVVAHKVSDSYRGDANPMGNPVDGHGVPVPHFGQVLQWNQFSQLVERVKKAGIKFEIEPYTRFA